MRFGMVSSRDLNLALDLQRRRGGRVGELLLEQGVITEEMLVWCLANQLNLPCVASLELRPEFVDREALRLLTPTQAWDLHLFPLLVAERELSVVTDDPLDRAGLEEVERQTGLQLNVAVAPPSLIRQALELYYGPRAAAVPGHRGQAAPTQRMILTSQAVPGANLQAVAEPSMPGTARPPRSSGASSPAGVPFLSLVGTAGATGAQPGAASAAGLGAGLAGGHSAGTLAAGAETYTSGTESGSGDGSPEARAAETRAATRAQALEQFLTERLTEGFKRIRLDGHYVSGWMDGSWQALGTPGATGELLHGAILEAIGYPSGALGGEGPRNGAQVRSLKLGVLRGTVAVGPMSITASMPFSGPALSVVIMLEPGIEFPAMSEVARHQLRSLGERPGLWLLAVDDRLTFRSLAHAIRQELGPFWQLADESLSASAGAASPSCLEALGIVSQGGLILSGVWRQELLAYLQNGRPEVPICIQVPVSSVAQALRVMRSAGFSGPELSGSLRGVLTVSADEARHITRLTWSTMTEEARRALESDQPSPDVARLMDSSHDGAGRELRVLVHPGGAKG